MTLFFVTEYRIKESLFCCEMPKGVWLHAEDAVQAKKGFRDAPKSFNLSSLNPDLYVYTKAQIDFYLTYGRVEGN